MGTGVGTRALGVSDTDAGRRQAAAWSEETGLLLDGLGVTALREGEKRGAPVPAQPYTRRPHPSRAQLLTARCPRARWTQQRSPRGLQPYARRHASLGSGAETTPGDWEPHPATGGVAEQTRRSRKGRTAEEAPPPTRNFRRTSAFGAHGRLRESGVVDACALTSSWAGGPRCRPGSISTCRPDPGALGEHLRGAFREAPVKGASGGEGLETSGFAGSPCAQLGARFVREEGGVNRLRDVSKVVQPRNPPDWQRPDV
ncbi:unnamed protein product [Rangifer tarandus platyrhynchus]|uniref:Uncharacterized protein n=2 Tax=Rangifer tarandus platyrhynchus TaxID=3082113 RepID=A0ABN8YW49_RANTA|nr:unnamed protein product [Rangifer tarandus platyrhynchus]CAI9693620.1 unnamed protein product [Rangifer tarandus platyrhynchus]